MGDPISKSKPFTCVTCEIGITGRVTFHVGVPFCCGGCVAGGPCTCSYDELPGDPQVRHCLDIEGPLRSRADATRVERLAVSSR